MPPSRQPGRRVNKELLSIMVSPPINGRVATLFNGDPVDRTWLPSPLVKQNWLRQVKLFSKERIYPLWYLRWPMQAVTLRFPAIKQQHSIWFGMDQRQHGEHVISASKPCGPFTRCLGEGSNSHINLPLTWPLTVWQREWVRVASLRSRMTYVSSTTNLHHMLCLVSAKFSHYFNIHMCLPHVEQPFHLSMFILFLCTYEFIESLRLTRCLGDSNLCSMSWRPPPVIVEWQSDWGRIMRACSAWHCGVDPSRIQSWFQIPKCSRFVTSLRLSLWSAWVRVNSSMGSSL